MTNVTSAFIGITAPVNELHEQIQSRGWESSKISWDKSVKAFVAEAKNPHGETMRASGPNDRTALGHLLEKIVRREHIRSASLQHHIGMGRNSSWKSPTPDTLQALAEEYAQAPVYEGKVAGYWKELAEDSRHRADVIRQQVQVEVTDEPEPYASAQEMLDDIHQKQNFLVSRANSSHPVWSIEDNVNFRIVHDVMGHGVSGGNFDWVGELKACAAHAPLLSPTAQVALLCECFTPETLVRTESGYRPIGEIKVGDRVLSGDGSFNRVKHVVERDHKGEIYNLETSSSLGAIRTTANHPFRALVPNHPKKTRRNAIREQYCNPGKCGKAGTKAEERHDVEWLEAERLTDKSYVATCVLKETQDITKIALSDEYTDSSDGRILVRKHSVEFDVTDEFLWVVGMYLAEGSVRAKDSGLSFGLHQDEIEYAKRITDFFEGHGFSTYLRNQKSKGIEVLVHSTVLGRWFGKWLGKGCQNKSIPSELLNLPNHRIQCVVDGIMAGDGWNAGNLLGQTSAKLALQVAEVCLRNGGHPFINIARPQNKRVVYYLNEASAPLIKKRRRGIRGYWDICDEVMVRVKKNEPEYYEGKVYCLSVENDPTFVVQNIVVHNCVYQTAYASYYRSFGPQKIFSPKLFNPLEEHTGVDRGIHPSQTVVPTSAPQVPEFQQPVESLPKGTVAPHQEPASSVGTFAATESLIDPNHGYSTEHGPTQGYNAYMEHGDPLQAKAVMDNASLIDTKWSKMDPNDPSDRSIMKQAIVNAFRVVLLSPRKDLRDNAIHYQDISHIPADVTDPKAYWDALEEKRKAHNVARGRDPEGHMSYFKPRKKYYRLVQGLNPQLSWDEVVKKVDTQIYHWRVDEERQIHKQDAHKAPEKQKPADEVDRKVNKAITDRLKSILDDAHDPKTDKEHEPAATALFSAQQDIFTGEDSSLYGAFMGTHLKAIAQISQHSDAILDAALQDVQEHDGGGHYFRANVLGLEVSGVGPKVCSFAWLLLQPMTSQLATIDTHMMDVLGHDYEKKMNSRDYFKFERQLQAGRDSSGYSHVPLGAFQWGMWDLKRNGQGQHQDHSAMRVLDPKPHKDVDWNAKTEATQTAKADWAKNAPEWWRATEDVRNHEGELWDTTMGSGVSQSTIPFQRMARKPGTWGKDFKIYWNRHKPFSKNEAKKMAEYAVGTKMTKTAITKWLEDHKSDIRGDYDEFVKKFMAKFKRINRQGKAAPKDPWVPWIQTPMGFHTGLRGQSYASFIRESQGISGPEYWKLKDAALGKYNPLTRELVIGAGEPDQQEILDSLSVLHFHPDSSPEALI
jgi:hypothetical protein